MTHDWKETLIELKKTGAQFFNANPEVITAYRKLNEAVGQGTHLDDKTRELISLAVAVTTRCEGCISSHSAAAVKAGATAGEVAEALGTAIALNAGAAYVYSSRALQAFDQFSEK